MMKTHGIGFVKYKVVQIYEIFYFKVVIRKKAEQ